MKKIMMFIVSLLVMNACTKNEELTPVTQVVPPAVQTGTQESVGTFSGSGSYTASGTVKVIADKLDAKKKYLSFENFKVSNGPDLYVYLAEDKTSKGFTSVVKLDKTGTFVLDIPAGADLTKQKFVLVWCRQFTVLFGSAKLE